MSLDCLKDFIGVQGCTTTTPDSGIFINQLPGVELEMIDSLADEQQVDFIGVYDDIQERAVRRLKTDVNAEFKKRHLLKNITQSIDLGRNLDFVDFAVARVAAPEYRGIALTLRRQDKDFAYSNLQTIYVQEVSVFFTSLNPTTIKIFDIQTGVELFSKDVPAPLDTELVSVQVNQTFESREIIVVYDGTLLDAITYDLQRLKNAVNRRQDGCNLFSISCDDGNRNAELRGMFTPNQNNPEEDIVFGDNSFGLTVKWSVICSFDTFVCNNKETFTRSLWYLLGIELMWERMFTDRLSRFTTFDNNRAKELAKLFEVIYRGGTIDDIVYEGELFMAIDAMDLNDSDYCLECYSEVRIDELI